MEKENFTISCNSNYSSNLIYLDQTCQVECNVSDYRDKVLWTGIAIVVSKENGKKIKLTIEQQKELYRRIYYLLNKKVYVDKLGFIDEHPHSLQIPLLDWRPENDKSND